jgi:upstream activation factor subunit UAF30
VRLPVAIAELYCARTARYATLWADASSVLFKGDLMAKTAKKSAPRKANAAFMKPMTPSPQLAEVIGDKPMPRTEVTKKLWAYIKKNGLQDAKNRRNINADGKLKPVFGGKGTVSMFEMTKLVSKHLK